MSQGNKMDYLFLTEPMKMTIEAMRPHWALVNFDLWGDSMVVFRGTMDVEPKDMIDLKEMKRGTVFPSGDLLHFVIEHFGDELKTGVLRQNILVNIAEEKLGHRLGSKKILRWGDDLYDEDRRITLTAVAQTPVSVKIHLGICIDSDQDAGFVGLNEYDLDYQEVAEVIGNQYRADMKRLMEKCWRMRAII